MCGRRQAAQVTFCKPVRDFYMNINRKKEFVFGEESRNYQLSAESFIKRVASLPLPYTGNKKKLLLPLYDCFAEYAGGATSVLDAFSGSSVVSMLLKYMGKNVISNDLLTCCYMYAVSLVENDTIDLNDDDISFLLNTKTDNASTFVRTNWQDKYFTASESERLDHFRTNVETLSSDYAQSLGLTANKLICMRLPFGGLDKSKDVYSHRKKQISAYGKNSDNHDRRIGIYYDDNMNLDFDKWFPKYLKSIQNIIATDKSSNAVKIKRAMMLCSANRYVVDKTDVGGRHYNGQVIAKKEHRLKHKRSNTNTSVERYDADTKEVLRDMSFGVKDMRIERFSALSGVARCIATNCDTIDLLQSGFADVDCVYFDPPYGGSSSDYATMYRFFEEYIYSAPISELEHIQKSSKRFANHKTYEDNFSKLLESAISIPLWIFSYNDSSWKNVDDIVSMIKRYKSVINVRNLNYSYKLRKDRKSTDLEYIIVAEN